MGYIIAAEKDTYWGEKGYKFGMAGQDGDELVHVPDLAAPHRESVHNMHYANFAEVGTEAAGAPVPLHGSSLCTRPAGSPVTPVRTTAPRSTTAELSTTKRPCTGRGRAGA